MHRGRVWAIRLSLGAVAVASCGCHKALFDDKVARTQFETYDLMRQRYVPTEKPDVFGNPQPALRARLTRSR